MSVSRQVRRHRLEPRQRPKVSAAARRGAVLAFLVIAGSMSTVAATAETAEAAPRREATAKRDATPKRAATPKREATPKRDATPRRTQVKSTRNADGGRTLTTQHSTHTFKPKPKPKPVAATPGPVRPSGGGWFQAPAPPPPSDGWFQWFQPPPPAPITAAPRGTIALPPARDLPIPKSLEEA
jgi:hypothetical protein